jgi:hypothetical protein
MKTRSFFGWSIFGHVQNLTDGERGALWRNGRAWLHMNPERSGKKVRGKQLHAEWSIPDRHPGIGFTWTMADGEDDWSVSIGVGLFHLYFSVDGFRSTESKFRKDKAGHYQEGRVTDIRFFDKGVWWQIWHPEHSWSNQTPRWRHGAWHPLDTLLGDTTYSGREISTSNVLIPMPEGTYPATVALTEHSWKRPRAWWTSVQLRQARIEMITPIPHPGKGENSYDCEDDATYSLTTEARNEAEAIGAMVATVMRSRQKYGGLNWQPKQVSTEGR